MAFEVKKKILEEIQKDMNCRRCKKFPGKGRMYKCKERNHSLCEPCRSMCPCGSEANPDVLSEKLRSLLPNPCQNHLDGCKELLMESDLPDHEAECTYRKVNCADAYCTKKVPILDYMNHIIHEHDLKSLSNGSVRKVRFTEGAAYWAPTKIEQHGRTFFLVGLKSMGIECVWLYLLGTLKEATNYTFVAKMVGPLDEEISYKGPVLSVDVSSSTILETHQYFCLGTTKYCQRFRQDDGFANFQVEIISSKEEVKDENDESGISDED